MTTPIKRILDALDSKGYTPKRKGNSATACCPAHEDHNPSLSISEGDDGRALLRCHAGCETSKIVAALGLKESDLFAKRPAKVARNRIVTTYDYTDENGVLLFQCVRYEPKTFKQRRPDGEGGWTWNIQGVRRVLFNLPKLVADPSATVFIVEGEKDCLRLGELGIVATTCPLGSGKWSGVNDAPLHGRKVVIVPDNDEAGRKHGDEVAAALQGKAADVRIVDLSADMPDLGEKGDVSNWLDAGGTAERFKALAAKVPQWKAPSSPNKPVLQFRPYPVNVLPTVIQRFVEEASVAIGCDPCFIALPLLSMLASCIGTTRCVKIRRSWREPAVIWTMVIAESGTKKTPAASIVLQPLRERQRYAFDEHAAQMKVYEKELAEYERGRHQRGKNQDDISTKPEEPKADRYLISDVTTESVAPILQNNERGVLLARDELAGWIGAFDRYAGGGHADAAHWLSIWSCEPILVDRKTSGTIYVPMPSVSICGTIQPAVFGRVLNQEHRDSGLASRLLLAMPPRRPGYWTEKDISPAAEQGLATVVDELLKLGHDLDHAGHLSPKDVLFSAAAKKLFIKWHDDHEDEMIETVRELAYAFAKLRGYVCRIALVLHLSRAAGGERVGSAIDEQSVKSAIEIIKWHKNEARRIYGMLNESPEDNKQRCLMDTIHARGGSVTVRDLTHGVSAFRNKTDDARKALNGLVESGHGQWVTPPPGPQGGRPTERFELSSITKTPGDDPASGGFGYGDSGDGGDTPIGDVTNDGVDIDKTSGGDDADWGEV